MRRRIFALAAAISLLLCMGTVALWVRSYWINEGWQLASHPIPLSIPYRLMPDENLSTGSRAGRWITSSKGKLQFYENDYPAFPWDRGPELLGYRRGFVIVGPNRPVGTFTPPGERHWSVPGIAHSTRPAWSDGLGSTASGYSSITVALWMPALLTLILPAFWMRRRWRQLREKNHYRRNLCLTCSYNLTGNVSGVCPECGTPVPQRSEAAV